MTVFAVRPLRPALSLPSTLCNGQTRPAPAKLSLFIPASIDSSTLNVPSPSCRTSGTPIAGRKPTLSLNFGNETRRTSNSKLSCSPSSDDESTASQEDITSRNTAVNTHLGSGSCNTFGSCRWTRTYSYTAVCGKRSILKGSPSHSLSNSPSSETMTRGVTFESEHIVIPSPSEEEEEEEEYEFIPRKHELEDIDNMSPPSTTSSTDSDESESDSEPKTPVDDEDTRGRCVDRFASALSRSGKWKRSKREWVWTLGGSDSNDIMQELEYSSANLMQVEAI